MRRQSTATNVNRLLSASLNCDALYSNLRHSILIYSIVLYSTLLSSTLHYYNLKAATPAGHQLGKLVC